MCLCQPSECGVRRAAGSAARVGAGPVRRLAAGAGACPVGGAGGGEASSALLAEPARAGEGAWRAVAGAVAGGGAEAGGCAAADRAVGRAGHGVGAGECGPAAAQPGSAEGPVREAQREACGRQRRRAGAAGRGQHGHGQHGHGRGAAEAVARGAGGSRRASPGEPLRPAGAGGTARAGGGQLPVSGLRAALPPQRRGCQRTDRDPRPGVPGGESGGRATGRPARARGGKASRCRK